MSTPRLTVQMYREAGFDVDEHNELHVRAYMALHRERITGEALLERIRLNERVRRLVPGATGEQTTGQVQDC